MLVFFCIFCFVVSETILYSELEYSRIDCKEDEKNVILDMMICRPHRRGSTFPIECSENWVKMGIYGTPNCEGDVIDTFFESIDPLCTDTMCGTSFRDLCNLEVPTSGYADVRIFNTSDCSDEMVQRTIHYKDTCVDYDSFSVSSICGENGELITNTHDSGSRCSGKVQKTEVLYPYQCSNSVPKNFKKRFGISNDKIYVSLVNECY